MEHTKQTKSKEGQASTQGPVFSSHIECRKSTIRRVYNPPGFRTGFIPFSAFWLRSSVVSVLISLISDTRLIEPHDINLIFLGGGAVW